MRVGSLLLAGLFALFAAVQWNDPDPFQWIAIYLAAAVLAGGASFLPIPSATYGVLAFAAFVWAATLLPNILSEASFTGTEVERECGGLLIVGLGMLGVQRAYANRGGKSDRSPRG